MLRPIGARRLAERLDSNERFTLVDTRPEGSYEAWHVEGAHNVPFERGEVLDPKRKQRIDELVEGSGGGPLITICGKGVSSTHLAHQLTELGYDAVEVVKGGMEEWSELYERVPVEVSIDDLVVVQIQRRAKGCLGYVVGSKEANEAVVVDPPRHVDEYKIAAADASVRIKCVIDTHVHADHLSGGSRLARELDVPYYLSEYARDRGVEAAFEPLSDGDVGRVGEHELELRHAPGHTTEQMVVSVDDELLLSADAVFVDSVGRVELEFGDEDAERGARMQYGTLHDVILDHDDDVAVLPGHVSVAADGTFETGNPGQPVRTTVADLRETLDLAGLDEESFVDELLDRAPEKPPNYETIVDANIGRTEVADEIEATELEIGPNNCAA